MTSAERSPLKRFFALFAIVAVLGGLTQFAQAEQVRTVTASVNVRDVLAGQTDQLIRITVTNGTPSGLPDETDLPGVDIPIPPGPSDLPPDVDLPALPEVGRIINFVVINPAAGLANIHKAQGFQGPWQFRTTSTGIVFQGGTLLPGQSVTFRFYADILRPAVDTTSPWSVGTSTDNGLTIVDAPGTTPGALDTLVRVLNVETFQVNAPAGAVDRSVTAGQDNVAIGCTVVNAGSGTLSTTTTLAGTVLATGVSDTRTFAPGERITIPFTAVTFGPAGTGNVTCDAAATGADGYAQTRAFTVQTAATFALGGPPSVTPGDVVQGASYPFSVSVVKTGEVSANIAPVLKLECPAVVTTTLSNVAFGANDQNATLVFPPATMPAVPDGFCTTALTITGTDVNGAIIAPPVLDGNNIVIDFSLPVIAPAIVPPPSRIAGEPAAITDNATLNFEGVVTRFGQPCKTCTITEAKLLQFNGLAPLTSIDVTATLTNGVIGGNYAGAYAPTATDVQLQLTVTDNANRSTTINASNKVPVDNIDPKIVAAKHVRQEGRSVIVLTISEAIGGKVGILDFTIHNDQDGILDSVVTHAFRSAKNEVTLELLLPLDQDATPNVSFAPTCVNTALSGTQLCNRAFDRVDRSLAALPNAITAVDRIAPGEIAITAVNNDAGDLNGGFRTFYTNKTTTPFALNAVRNGWKVDLVIDTNGNSELDATDERLVDDRTIAGAIEGAATITAATNGEAVHQLFAIAQDAAGNSGTPTLYGVVFDHIRPVIANADVIGLGIVMVQWSESMLGRDFAADWKVLGKRAGVSRAFNVGVVEIPGSDRRKLTIDDAAFSNTWTICGVKYEYLGVTPTLEIYHDRPGNQPLEAPDPTTFLIPGAC